MTRAAAPARVERPAKSDKSASKAPVKAPAKSSKADRSGYFARSESPLTTLAFLLPLVVFYELGTHLYGTDPVHHTEQRIKAFNLMLRFFAWCGATGRYLPAAAVVVILLAWHLARKDVWRVSPLHLLGMTLESALLGVPLIIMGQVMVHYLPLWAAGDTRGLIVLSVGAGVYEELVFRLIAFSGINLLLVDLWGMKKGWAGLLMVLSTSLLFSHYHYWDGEPFQWQTFAFRALGGCYFGIIFLCRGFGITAGSHAGYDVLIVTLRAIQ